MIDIEKQIAYWRNSSDEDWVVAWELVENGRARHGLFFAHLAVEKMLKAHICLETQSLAPKIHTLVRLAELAKLPVSKEQRGFLGRFNQYQLEGRYPDMGLPIPKEKAKVELKQAEVMLKWLKSQF